MASMAVSMLPWAVSRMASSSGCLSLSRPQQLDAAHARQVQVEQGDVAASVADFGQGFLASYSAAVTLVKPWCRKRCANPIARSILIVVHDQEPKRRGYCLHENTQK